MSQSIVTDSDLEVQEYIAKRQQNLTNGFNNASVPALMAMFADDVEFNDYAMGVLNLNRISLEQHFDQMMATCRNIDMRTKSISGSKYFTVWEWNLTGYELPSEPGANGRHITIVGVSIAWWNVEGKIIKNNDYGKEVPNA